MKPRAQRHRRVRRLRGVRRLRRRAARRSSATSRRASTSYVGIYLIALLGLNILTGYTGQISLGHGAFMAIGGYTTAILMAGNEQFGGPIAGGMKDVWTIPIAGLVAGLVGLAFGLPALRLSGLYLALATFAIAVAMPSTVKRFAE